MSESHNIYEFRVKKAWPYHVSCGGPVYKIDDGSRKYALLYRKPSRDKDSFESWHLPKGTLSSDETLDQCTLREIKEETGFETQIIKYLGASYAQYFHSGLGYEVERIVHYFLCEYTSGDSINMDHEHDAVEWYTAQEAIERLKIHPKQENRFIERAEKYFKLHEAGEL